MRLLTILFYFSLLFAQNKNILKFQTLYSPSTEIFKLDEAWAKSVYNRLEIKLLPVRVVGKNILQGHISAPAYFTGLNPSFTLFGNLVGAYKSPYELLKFMNQGGGGELYDELINPYNLEYISTTTQSFESLVSKNPLRGIKDLKGLNMPPPQGLMNDKELMNDICEIIITLFSKDAFPTRASECYF